MNNPSLHSAAARLVLAAFALSTGACAILGKSPDGLSPEERASTVRNRPLSKDKSSTLSRMTVQDDGVALKIAEF